MWEAAENFLTGTYDAMAGVFGDEFLEEGIRAGIDYAFGDDDTSSSGNLRKRLRGRVSVGGQSMRAAGGTKAPASRVTSQYDVVYNKYNTIFRNAIAQAKSTTVSRRG